MTKLEVVKCNSELQEGEYQDYVVVAVDETMEYTLYLVATSLLHAVQKAVVPEGATITKAYLHE